MAQLSSSISTAPARIEPGPPGQLLQVPSCHKPTLPVAVAKSPAAILTALFLQLRTGGSSPQEVTQFSGTTRQPAAE